MMSSMESRLQRLEVSMSEVKTDVATLKERASHLVTSSQMYVTAGVLAAALAAGVWGAFVWFSSTGMERLAELLSTRLAG